MNNKQLIDVVEAIKEEIYKIIRREQNKLTAVFKEGIKAIIDERTRRGELSIGQVMWSCGDCVLSVLNMNIIPWIESQRYQELKDSLNESVVLKMVPDAEPIILRDDLEVQKEEAKAEALNLQMQGEGFTPEYNRAIKTVNMIDDKIKADDFEYLQGLKKSIDAKLNNERFVENAKPEIIENERIKQVEVEAKLKEITVAIKADTSSLEEYIVSEDFKEVSKNLEAMKLTDEELNEKIREAIKIEKSGYNPDERSITVKPDIDRHKMKENFPTVPAKKTRNSNKKK